MPVHAVKIETSRISSGTPVPTAVGNLLAGLSTALDGDAIEFKEVQPTPDEALSEVYYAGLYRFEEDAYDPTELLDRIEGVLSPLAKWYRLRYHRCYRDIPTGEKDPERHGCEWDAEVPPRLSGPVPSDLAGPTDPNA